MSKKKTVWKWLAYVVWPVVNIFAKIKEKPFIDEAIEKVDDAIETGPKKPPAG